MTSARVLLRAVTAKSSRPRRFTTVLVLQTAPPTAARSPKGQRRRTVWLLRQDSAGKMSQPASRSLPRGAVTFRARRQNSNCLNYSCDSRKPVWPFQRSPAGSTKTRERKEICCCFMIQSAGATRRLPALLSSETAHPRTKPAASDPNLPPH